MVRANVVTVMRFAQDEVNQEESELNRMTLTE